MNVIKHLMALAVVASMLSLRADVMDKKMAVLKTVETSCSGRVEITCDDTKGWSFDVAASVDDGRDVVTVTLTRGEASRN